jgi:hypothetical protein
MPFKGEPFAPARGAELSEWESVQRALEAVGERHRDIATSLGKRELKPEEGLVKGRG